jgi:hypothetical protein
MELSKSSHFDFTLSPLEQFVEAFFFLSVLRRAAENARKAVELLEGGL